MRRPAPSKPWASLGDQRSPIAWPGSMCIWPAARTSSCWLPIAQRSTRSAPRYSLPCTVAAKPSSASSMSSGRSAQLCRLRAGRDVAAGDASAVELQQVHRRRADEARHEGAGRARVQVARAAGLLDGALVQQHHLVGHAHRLALVVGDIDHRQAQLALQVAQFTAHVLAQLRIEIRQRLVHQAHLGLRDQRAAQRHPLLLPARQLRRLALQQRAQAQQIGHLRQPRSVFIGRHTAHRQAEADVLRHVQVREQRVVLEHHRDAALGRRQLRDIAPVNQHAAAAGRIEPGDDAQGGRLAAARRPQQHAEAAGIDAQIHRAQRSGRAPVLGNTL